MNGAVEIVTPRESCAEAADRFVAAKMREGFEFKDLHRWRDADGTVRYFRIRLKHPATGEKWIRPFYLNGSGEYVMGEPPAPKEGKLLYRLPDVVADSDAPVFIVEGESCADALHGLGIVATTSGSCDSAGAADWEPLRRRQCVIWPDRDEAGRRYADEVTAKLRAQRCTIERLDVERLDVEALNLPAKGDAVDWLREHPAATADDVLSLPTVVPQKAAGKVVTAITAQELISREFPTRENYLGGFITSQSLGMVHAWRGIGKTHLAIEIAYAIASGGTYLKWEAPEARRVLYLDGEMPGAVLQERVARIAASADLEPPDGYLRFVTPDVQDGPLPDLATPEGQEQYDEALEGVSLIIVDNLSCLARRGGKENESESWLPVADWALRQRAQGRAVIFIHHSGKGGLQRGTSRREDLLDWVITLRRPMDYRAQEGARFVVSFEKARGLVGDAVSEFEATLGTDEHGRRSWTMANVEDAELARVAELVKTGATQKDVADELSLSRFQAGRRIKAAIEAGFISTADVKQGRGGAR